MTREESHVPAILLLYDGPAESYCDSVREIERAWDEVTEKEVVYSDRRRWRSTAGRPSAILKNTIDHQISKSGGWRKDVGPNQVVCLGDSRSCPTFPIQLDGVSHIRGLLSQDLGDSIRLLGGLLGTRIQLTAAHPVLRPSKITHGSWWNSSGISGSTITEAPLTLHIDESVTWREFLSRIAEFHSCVLEADGAGFRLTDMTTLEVRERLAGEIAGCEGECGCCTLSPLSSETASELIPYLHHRSPAVVEEVLTSLYATELRESKWIVGSQELRRLVDRRRDTIDDEAYALLDIQQFALTMLVFRGEAEDLARVEAVAKQEASRNRELTLLDWLRHPLRPNWEPLDLALLPAESPSPRAAEYQDAVIRALGQERPALVLRRVNIGELPIEVTAAEAEVIARRSVSFLNNIIQAPAGRRAFGDLCFSEDGSQSLFRVVLDRTLFDRAYRAIDYEVRLTRKQGGWLVVYCTSSDIIG